MPFIFIKWERNTTVNILTSVILQKRICLISSQYTRPTLSPLLQNCVFVHPSLQRFLSSRRPCCIGATDVTTTSRSARVPHASISRSPRPTRTTPRRLVQPRTIRQFIAPRTWSRKQLSNCWGVIESDDRSDGNLMMYFDVIALLKTFFKCTVSEHGGVETVVSG